MPHLMNTQFMTSNSAVFIYLFIYLSIYLFIYFIEK